MLAARDPSAALGSTVIASERLAEACAAAGVQRLVYLSTVHVYGARMAAGATLSEDMRAEPRSAYAISRLASEHIVSTLAAGAYELVILRLTNSVGAPADPSVDRWSLVANDLARQGALRRAADPALGRSPVARLRGRWATCARRSWPPAAATAPACGPAPTTSARAPPATVLELAGLIQDAFAAPHRRAPRARCAPSPTRSAGPLPRLGAPAGRARRGRRARRCARRSRRRSSFCLDPPRGAAVSEIHDVAHHPAAPDPRRARRDPAHAAGRQPRLRALRRDLLLAGLSRRRQGLAPAPADDAQLRRAGRDGQARLLRRPPGLAHPRQRSRRSTSASSTTRW